MISGRGVNMWGKGLGVRLGVALAALSLAATGATAQVRTVDPNAPFDADLRSPPRSEQEPVPADENWDTAEPAQTPPPAPARPASPPPARPAQGAASTSSGDTFTAASNDLSNTYDRDDLISAAEGVFGRGAAGLAGILENILADQGQPNAYIAGREAAGAFVLGIRYGSGTMHHKVEGEREVYWTGPSVGFDVGGDATKTFVLVYNLYDSQELYRRFPAAEGRVYFVGGFAATYLRRGDVVLIPVRLGVGWRLGANIGYMNFTEKARWLPF